MLDVSASYPNGEVVFNISKETTKKELISIDGVTDYMRRAQGINLSGGATNAVEVCTGLFKMPGMSTWLEAYQNQGNIEEIKRKFQHAIDDATGAAEALGRIKENEEEEAPAK